jgi:uncharacterized membrane protein YccC
MSKGKTKTNTSYLRGVEALQGALLALVGAFVVWLKYTSIDKPHVRVRNELVDVHLSAKSVDD